MSKHDWKKITSRGLVVPVLGLMPILAGCLIAGTSKAKPLIAQVAQVRPQPEQSWRPVTAAEKAQTWDLILNSPLGIAALNQLAIEGFVSPVCPKRFYLNQKYDGFQTLLQVKCPEAQGASIALGFKEIRVTFNRFEDNIESFEVERVYPDRPTKVRLPKQP